MHTWVVIAAPHWEQKRPITGVPHAAQAGGGAVGVVSGWVMGPKLSGVDSGGHGPYSFIR